MKKQKLTAISVILFLAMMFSAGCETYSNFMSAFFENGDNPDTIVRIGVYQPLSGKYQEFGELERIGIELAHENFPRALRKEVELIYADNKSDMYIAETVIQTLIDKDPAVVLGSYGGLFSLIAAEYLEEAKIPAIAITNTNWLVTSNNPYYFRVCFVYAYEGIAVAKYAVEEMGVSSAAILKPLNDDSVIAVSQSFSDKMIQLTGNENIIVSSQDFDPSQTDYTEQLDKIKLSGAEVVFIPSNYYDAAKILIQAKEKGVRAVFLGTDNWETPEFLEMAGEAAEGVAFSTIFDPESGITEMTEVFLKAYRRKFGDDAVPPSAVALGFDAYMLAIDSINRAGTSTDKEKIRDALSKTREFPGASGSITFDIKGDPIKSVVIKTIQDGEIVAKYTVEPVWVDMTNNDSGDESEAVEQVDAEERQR